MDLFEQAAAEKVAAEKVAAENITNNSTEPEQELTQPAFRIGIPDFSFLKARTGEGTITEYINDPLNYDNKLSTARILRGLTGLAGRLDYAVIDIGLGILEKAREKNNNEPEINTGNE